MRSSSSSEEEVKFDNTKFGRVPIKHNVMVTKESMVMSEIYGNRFKIKLVPEPHSTTYFYNDSDDYTRNSKNYRFRKRSNHNLSSTSESTDGESDTYVPQNKKPRVWSMETRCLESMTQLNNNLEFTKETAILPQTKKLRNNLPHLHKKVKCTNNLTTTKDKPNERTINSLPQEILLEIFRYFTLHSLIYCASNVCKTWETLAMDWTLWKKVESLSIENMAISTHKLRLLLKAMPNLKKLELVLRNDIEELFDGIFERNKNLESLSLDRCYRSSLHINILSQTVTSILKYCPKLTCINISETYFHSKNVYKCLAEKFKNLERINITCTTKSEMNIFIEHLSSNIPNVEFQQVPMMGRADGKQIYWGPILGLLVRPIPTSPFYQFNRNGHNYPNYAF